jgi:hypothetical protein
MARPWLSWAIPFALIATWAEWLAVRWSGGALIVVVAGVVGGGLGAFLSRCTRAPVLITAVATLGTGVIGGVLMRSVLPWYLTPLRGALDGLLLSAWLLPPALLQVLALARASREPAGSIIHAVHQRTPWVVAAVSVALVSLHALGGDAHWAPLLACVLAMVVVSRGLALDAGAFRLLGRTLAAIPRCEEGDYVEAQRVVRVGRGAATFVSRRQGERDFRATPIVELAIVGDALAGWRTAKSALVIDGLALAVIVLATTLHLMH